MSDITNDTVNALLGLLQQAGVQLPTGPQAPAGGSPAPGGLADGWSQPRATRVDNLQAVAVPLKLGRPDGGNVKVMLLFGPEHGASADALHSLVDRLQELNMPVDAWSPRQGGGNDNGQGWDRSSQGRRDDRPHYQNRDRGWDDDRPRYRDDDRSGYRDRYRDDRGGDRPRYGNRRY